MILTKEVMDFFQKKGINVRYYPERTFDEFKTRVYNDEVTRYVNYYKNHVNGCEAVKNGTANVLFNSLDELKAKAVKKADSSVLKYGRGLSAYDYNLLFIEYKDRLIVKKISQKSKEITKEYITQQIEKDEKSYKTYYGEFVQSIKNLMRKNGLTESIFNIYPTTYGIGVWAFYNFGFSESVNEVKNLLDKLGIEYYNEYSDAHYAYRFKISKKAVNRAKLA